MRWFRPLWVLYFAVALTAVADEAKPPEKPWDAALIERLPQVYRAAARQYADAPERHLEYFRKADDEQLLSAALEEIAQRPEGAKLLAGRVKQETSAEHRAQLVEALRPYARNSVEGKKLFEELAVSDPSSKVSLAAIDALVQNEQRRVSPMVKQRLALAKKQGDLAGADELQQRATDFVFGKTTLPEFAYQAPPVFAAAPANAKLIRVLAFGDFGTGDTGQISTAKAMRDYHQKSPFTFGITMGDNFYPRGIDTLDSPRWKSEWEDLYGPMGVKFYPTLGNHDYGFLDSPAAELAYTQKSKSWQFPAPFYSYTAGAVEFFAMDTVRLTQKQLDWLGKALAASKAQWKVVYGHYQIYSATRGDSDVDHGDLVSRLLPVLKQGKVDFYLCGHDHNMQELKPEDGVHFFVMGAGGASLYDMDAKYPRSLFQSQAYGFGVLEFSREKAMASLVGLDGKVLHKREITKSP